MKSLIAALTVLWFCLTPSFLPPAEPADVVFVNANVYTVNEKQPRAEAIAVKGDRIVFVGSNANAKRFQGRGTRVIDLHGETVVPGMTDAHYHRSEEHTSELQSPCNLVCRLLLEKKKTKQHNNSKVY